MPSESASALYGAEADSETLARDSQLAGLVKSTEQQEKIGELP
jgi:hypothetical protein